MDAMVEDLTNVSGGATDYGEQDEAGVDLSLIRENLRATPAERVRRADRARFRRLDTLQVGPERLLYLRRGAVVA